MYYFQTLLTWPGLMEPRFVTVAFVDDVRFQQQSSASEDGALRAVGGSAEARVLGGEDTADAGTKPNVQRNAEGNAPSLPT